MLRLKHGQRELLAETFKDIANVAAGAMIFGQFIGEGSFSFPVAVIGGSIWLAFVATAVRLSGWTTE